MRVLFATSRGDDYMSACTWDGLQELLGEENVFDAVNVPYLHPSNDNPVTRISATRQGRILQDEGDFDLLVLNSMFTREHDWSWAASLLPRLHPGAKIAYVEGWDCAREVHPPPFHVDAVFVREIDPTFTYPYQPHYFGFSAPSRWLCSSPRDSDRTYAVFAAYTYTAHPLRWECLSRMFLTKTRHVSIAASGGVGFGCYFDFLRQSKLFIAPPGGGGSSESMRLWEGMASGMIPIFVEMPQRVHENWFENESFSCNLSGLPDIIDYALSMDLTEMRQRLLDRVRDHHTTLQRAKQILKGVGL